MALGSPVLLRHLLVVVGILVACGDDAVQDPAPVAAGAGAAGTGGESAAGAGGGAGGDAGGNVGGDAGGNAGGIGGGGEGGGGNSAGQGGGGDSPPGCFNPGPGVCCASEKCYTPEELTTLGCSSVDLQTEGCPYPVELPMGNCYWYEESSKTEDGKCCYTHFSGDCCGPP
jgi:hypothetical protein